jgi:hypothetical protein
LRQAQRQPTGVRRLAEIGVGTVRQLNERGGQPELTVVHRSPAFS